MRISKTRREREQRLGGQWLLTSLSCRAQGQRLTLPTAVVGNNSETPHDTLIYQHIELDELTIPINKVGHDITADVQEQYHNKRDDG